MDGLREDHLLVCSSVIQMKAITLPTKETGYGEIRSPGGAGVGSGDPGTPVKCGSPGHERVYVPKDMYTQTCTHGHTHRHVHADMYVRTLICAQTCAYRHVNIDVHALTCTR